MKTLPEIRREIDEIDDALTALLVRRLRIAGDVAEAKRLSGKPVDDPARERAVLDRLATHVGAEFADEVRTVYATLFAQSKARQRKNIGKPRAEHIRTIAVAGLGLIGGSLYKAARAAGYTALGLHHGDSAGLDAADLIFVAQPPDAIVPWVKAHATQFRAGAVLIDVCGIKSAIMREMEQVPQRGWRFIGGHPMAGREVSGYANATEDLFRGASMILTPPEGFGDSQLDELKTVFADLGFIQTVVTTPARHDDMIAFTSQLCHVIATAYVRDGRVKDAVGFTAGSYANMTRIATQDATIWSQLYLENRTALLDALDGFIARLNEFKTALTAFDAAHIGTIIEEGTRAKRQELLDRQRGDECA